MFDRILFFIYKINICINVYNERLISLLKDINSAWKVFIYLSVVQVSAKLGNAFVLQTMGIVPSKIQWLQHLMDKVYVALDFIPAPRQIVSFI